MITSPVYIPSSMKVVKPEHAVFVKLPKKFKSKILLPTTFIPMATSEIDEKLVPDEDFIFEPFPDDVAKEVPP